jgi:hypothetical protein
MHLNIDDRVVKKGHESKQYAGVSAVKSRSTVKSLHFFVIGTYKRIANVRITDTGIHFLFKAPIFSKIIRKKQQ